MTNQVFQRYQCWDEQRISLVINKEAVSVDKATFLATHTPLDTITYLDAPHQIKDTSEANLLEELCARSERDQHTFAVIQGIPGTGKSHLIRWLKERYAHLAQESGGNDVVLLIERASSSLRSTLLQIIKSNVFDQALFADQIERLKRATDQLSKEGLADTVLNNLQVAVNEVALKEADQPSHRISRNIEKFLLDYVIREELKKPDGPIERIVRFLSGEGRSGLVDDEMPTFHADDFNFQVSFLREIKKQPDGYREAKKLAESLNLKQELRTELATYLNRLLSFAVGRTTSLSADELKQMFNELRRELRRQGRQLTLFIEDIAVFTGLDAGLVDVLATQHTGEGNREFCRLLSVVGITDGYYRDHFPDNMKQRITHRLTLNASGKMESQLLTSPDTVADMAARYLNAIRLKQDDLETWQDKGAEPEQLPNRCQGCQFKLTCHEAFGFIEIGEPNGDAASRVGLYPFNQQALWTMYSRLNTNKVSRTPRSLLNNVIEYVLQSHGWQVSEGLFPPSTRELGGDFSTPTLEKPAQRTLITNQSNSPTTANRLETVILFWGNKTLDAWNGGDGQQLVSGLSPQVFTAFDLPAITGENVGSAAEVSVPQTTPATTIAPTSTKPASSPSVGPPQTTTQVKPTTPKSQNPLTQDVEYWRTGGTLQNYERLAKGLANFASGFIDWQAYGIPADLVDDRVRQARFIIEGQAGRSTRSYHLEFKRSDELALVLHALVDLQDNDQTLEPEKYGSHLATLSRWMRAQEPRVVEFVKQPDNDQTLSLTPRQLLVQDNLLIACLGDGLSTDKSTPVELFFSLVEINRVSKPWNKLIVSAQETHTKVWVGSMKRIRRNVDPCQQALFPAFNCAQGSSRDLRFIDAATMLDLIKEFNQQKWQMNAVDIKPDGDLWTNIVEIYGALRLYFTDALRLDHEEIQNYQKRLKTLVGKDAPVEIFQAIQSMLADLRKSQIAFSFAENPTFAAEALEHLRMRLQKLPSQNNTVKLALWLSGSTILVKTAKRYLEYLESFYKMARDKEKLLDSKIRALQASTNGTSLHQKVQSTYTEIQNLLDETSSPVKSKEK